MDALDGTIFHVVPIFVQFHKKESTQENCHQKNQGKNLNSKVVFILVKTRDF